MSSGIAASMPMPLGGICRRSRGDVTCVCWNASSKKTIIFCLYSGIAIHPSMSVASCVGSASTFRISASVGGRPTRRFFTFAT